MSEVMTNSLGETFSDTHLKTGEILESIIAEAKNMGDFAAMLKAKKIYFEDYQLANCHEFLIFTAPNSFYDIVGYAIYYEKGKNKPTITELY